MKCLETRTTPEGFKRRRYERADGERVTTIEIPLELWDRVAGPDAPALKQRAQRLYLSGESTREIAATLGVTKSTIHRWVT